MTKPEYVPDGPRSKPKFAWPRRSPSVVQTASGGAYETLVYLQLDQDPPVLNIRRYWNHPSMGRVPTPVGFSMSLESPGVLNDLIAALERLRPEA